MSHTYSFRLVFLDIWAVSTLFNNNNSSSRTTNLLPIQTIHPHQQQQQQQQQLPPDVKIATSLQDAWQQLAQRDDVGEIFIIGGAQIYQQALEQNYGNKIMSIRLCTHKLIHHPICNLIRTFRKSTNNNGNWLKKT
jgi:hypothetical protein